VSDIITARMQVRRDTEANWASNNPVLLSGEIGYVTDEHYFKIGDGSTAWNGLAEIITGNDGAWTTATLANGWTGTVRYKRTAGHVTVVFDTVNGSSVTDNAILQLPSGYRPYADMRFVTSDFASNVVVILITSGGTFGTSTRNSTYAGTITFPVI
jgi:hypothetical protein